MRTPLLGLAAVLALTLTACSSDDSGGTDERSGGAAASEAAGGVQDCADVWADGQTLPDDYDGCAESDGVTSAAIYYDCDDGRKLASYEGDTETAWAFYGETISVGDANDPDYAAAFDACRP